MSASSGDKQRDQLGLGARLRLLREAHGLVLQDVADLFGANRNVPSQWELGAREPSYQHLLRLADFYGVTVDWLLGREAAEKDSPRVRLIKSRLIDFLRLQEAAVAYMTPGARMALAIRYLQAQDPAMFALERLAMHMLISAEALEQMLTGQAIATGLAVQRFAHFVNLPEIWFYHPQPHLEDGATRYRTVLDRLLAEGMAPEEVEQRIWGGRRSRRPVRK